MVVDLERQKKREKKWRKEYPELMRKYRRKWEINNPHKAMESKRKSYKKWRKNNIEKERKRNREYYKQNKDKLNEWNEDKKKRQRDYRRRNVEKVRETNRKYRLKRHKNDLMYRLNVRMGCSIRKSLRLGKDGYHWETLVGYTLQDLMDRLSVNFKKGMTWDNYGKWHIDHKKPKSAFNFETPDDPEFKICWSLANLQPLWARDNLKKSNKNKN